MKLDELTRRAIDARLRAIEDDLSMIEGLVFDRRGDRIVARGEGVTRRRINDARLRFLGLDW